MASKTVAITGRVGPDAATGFQFQWDVAPNVLQFIGKQIDEFLYALQPIACQTCGQPLRGRADVAAHAAAPTAKVVLSLHHAKCLPSDLYVNKQVPQLRRPTVDAVTWAVESPWKRTSGPAAVMVVNPSCEQLVARLRGSLTGARRWREATLDELIDAGFGRSRRRAPGALTGVSAAFSDGQVTITCPGSNEPWSAPAGPDVARQLEVSGELTVAVTTLVAPRYLTDQNLTTGLINGVALIGRTQLR
jgi:hypothetical protein